VALRFACASGAGRQLPAAARRAVFATSPSTVSTEYRITIQVVNGRRFAAGIRRTASWISFTFMQHL
jgi:hypothetical protein